MFYTKSVDLLLEAPLVYTGRPIGLLYLPVYNERTYGRLFDPACFLWKGLQALLSKDYLIFSGFTWALSKFCWFSIKRRTTDRLSYQLVIYLKNIYLSSPKRYRYIGIFSRKNINWYFTRRRTIALLSEDRIDPWQNTCKSSVWASMGPLGFYRKINRSPTVLLQNTFWFFHRETLQFSYRSSIRGRIELLSISRRRIDLRQNKQLT